LRRLMVAGVNVSARDYDSRTALHLAAAEGSFGLVKMLVDAGADVCAQDRYRQSLVLSNFCARIEWNISWSPNPCAI
jgi:ankyrin repeat protein